MSDHPQKVTALAALAKLSLTQEEAQALDADLADMLILANQLEQAPEFPIQNSRALPRTRQDVPQKGLEREALLAAAGSTAEGYVTVPILSRGEDHA